MTDISDTTDELLKRLTETARTEAELVTKLADTIRRVDEQLLNEVRSVTRHHALRREAIFGELQELAQSLCALPRDAKLPERSMPGRAFEPVDIRHEIAHDPARPEQEPRRVGDWRTAAERIDSEIAEYFNGAPRH
ncbi:MAG: hypothetical protein NW216_14820 [Hyphomicrobium sp.]|nr:hypothetical protein [Hyphomicrobium sp.]